MVNVPTFCDQVQNWSFFKRTTYNYIIHCTQRCIFVCMPKIVDNRYFFVHTKIGLVKKGCCLFILVNWILFWGWRINLNSSEIPEIPKYFRKFPEYFWKFTSGSENFLTFSELASLCSLHINDGPSHSCYS